MKTETRIEKYPTVTEENTSVLSDEQKQEIVRRREPFNFGIKELKRVLDRMGMPKAEKNRTIKIYKERLYQRVEEVKEKMKDVVPTEGLSNATDTNGAVITTPERSA